MIQGPAPRISEAIVAKALPLPKVGSLVGGKKVTKVRVQDTDPNYYVVGISLEKGVKRKDVEASLMELLNVHVINSKEAGDLVVGQKHFEMVPTRNGPVVYIAMHIVPIIRSNPGKVLSPLEDFNMHYTKMEELNPKKWFRQFAFKNPHGPAYRDRLWKFVGYMGESYGYSDKDNIYHRRASTIMPKIKITKAVPNCDTFYHTHPSKDEPSLTSPDDYLLYFDLSYEPRSIRNFYTIMKDRIDHFKITPKKDSKGNYVRIGEDNFIDEVDAKIDELMEKYTDSFPMDKMGGLKFCEKVTRETVKWLNKKYGKYVTVKYNCYFRVRQNPPEPNYLDLHLGDTFISKAIADIQSGEYSWPKSDMDKKPQEAYAYWFGQYYFMEEDHSRQTALLAAVGTDDEVATMPRERSLKLGMLPGRLRAINHYLDQKVTRDYSYYDMMNLLNLHIDIMRIDSKITDGGGVKSRIEDMAEAMEIPQEVKDDLLVIEEARLLGPYTAEAKTLAGDYYVVLLLVDLCLRAVEIMEEVKAGTKDANYARYEVYNKLKQQAIEKIDGELLKYQKDFNRGKKAVLLNPATTLKKSEYSAFIPPQYLAVGGIVTEALEQFAPYEAGKPFITGKSKLNMRVPGGGTLVSVQLSSLNTGNLQLFVPAKGHPIPEDPDKAALDAYQEIVNRLNEYGLNIPTEEQEVGSTTVSNPRQDSQVILIAGPSGSGKSTTIRNLLKSLPNSKTVPTFTTRPKRKSDKAGEKRFVTKEQFKAMEAAGEFAESALQKNGNHYGRRREDFMGADYVVVDATLSGVNRLSKMFPNAYTVYLEPQESPEFIRQRLIRRGDMSPQEARGRSSLIPSHIRSSKMMSFDKRIITKQGHFNDIAVEILDSIPRNNPVIPFRIPPEAAPELDKRLTAMMQRQGYKPQTIKEAIAEGLYDDQPSNFSYAQGEYDEFLEEIAKGDMDEAFAEYSDVEGHIAYWLYTNHGIEVPIYNTIHLDKTRKRIEVFDNIFTEFGLEFDSKYLKGGSNFQKTTKVRLALETAAKDQGKPFTATDNEIRDAIAKAVPDVVMENPNPYYEAHLYASGSRDPFFPGDVPVAPPDLLRGNPSASIGQLAYTRSSKDPRGFFRRTFGKKRDPYVGHAERDFGLTMTSTRPRLFGLAGTKTIPQKKRLAQDLAKTKEQGGLDNTLGFHSTSIGGDGSSFSQGITMVPAQMNLGAMNRLTSVTNHMKEIGEYSDILPAMYIAGSGEPLVDKYGEYLSLRHRDADSIREAFYLIEHQMTTDHEFAHQSDIADGGYEFGVEDELGMIDGYRVGAETIAQTIEGAFTYASVARLDETNSVLALKVKKNTESVNESDKFSQPKTLKGYVGSDTSYEILRKGTSTTMTELVGYARMQQSEKGSILVNPKKRRREPVTLEQFTRWVQLVNMKNKELKRFLDSPLGKKAGINKEKQKEFGGINRGRTSGLAILRMRKKLGLSGPKDYIKNGPMIIKRYYDMALEKWNETDWYWCSRQISFNSRARGQRGPYTDKKGRPTRKLLALWVWGHDPWRYARKIENRVNMPPCPDVPWIGMTEKRKWGTTEFTYNPGRIPKKYEGQDPSEHSDLFTDEDPVNTIQGLGFKDKETAEKSINIIKRSGKTHAHKMQAAMAMEQRARFHAHQTPGIRAGQKVYAKFIEEMKEKTKAMRKNPPKVSHYEDPVQEEGFPSVMQRIDLHEDGQNIGYLNWWSPSTDKVWIHHLRVSPAHRKKGLGMLLIDELRKRPEVKGKKIHLHAPLRGGPRDWTSKWYERLGFELVDEDSNEMVLQNPRTPKGKKFPTKYLKGLTPLEKEIAIKEIDDGYEYDLDDPEAYKYWESDIKATARGYKTVPSKYQKKFVKMYGPLPEKGKFLDKIAKATKIKKAILQKVYDKGLAAWRVGHRPGVQQHQWAAGRVYSFVTLGNTVMKSGKKMPDYSLAVEAGLIKSNPSEWRHGKFAEDDPFEDMFNV